MTELDILENVFERFSLETLIFNLLSPGVGL